MFPENKLSTYWAKARFGILIYLDLYLGTSPIKANLEKSGDAKPRVLKLRTAGLPKG
jgi:ABC-type enterochelin transport system substrate-binding protein